ncbi:hypothetical protein DSCA_09150 [Desulfosarcina alkanivorans]|uniref:Prepilin-type N-terminal cleavage/methylation domain-containing protein n=1 Tax=Desulfosarcina alkanivorans TaxID=571177 RepID=A0A5K7YEW2_9BACT|nr:type II secretion system protein [Desulfosarcina alkanivorans]BBO66985.1 hypothetical protein DSCA_09150 [Desulfosarcina alkanivorans]
MKAAATATSIPLPLRRDAGFTLIEIIVSLVIAGILASVAGMGIVSAISGYAVVRENVDLSEKIQLAGTRIQRELLELTDIDDWNATRPYIVYYSATGRRQAIARAGDTVRLYNDPGEISDAYLDNNGDILTDHVDSLAFNYFQGDSNWAGEDIRELSTIEFSLKLARSEAAGTTMNLTTRVFLRNNDNYGGSAASVPAAPPSGGRYSCFIATAGSGAGSLAGLCNPKRTAMLIGWILLAGAGCGLFKAGGRQLPSTPMGRHCREMGDAAAFPSLPDSGSYPQARGSALIGIIITMLVFAALGAAIVPMISSSQLHRTTAGRSAQAYYLAESGLRFAASQYLNATGEAAQFEALDNLHGVTHRLQDNRGDFTVSVNPFYFVTAMDHTAATTLETRIYGSPGVSFPLAGGSLSIAGTVYTFSGASILGQQISFNGLSLPLTVSADTPVYPVARTSAGQTLSNGGDLRLSAGTGDLFPERNGSFVLLENTYTYRERTAEPDTLVGIRRTDGVDFADLSLAASQAIRLKKFVQITSNGVVGSGDTRASRDIVYHVQIPEEKESRRIVFEETFDDLDEWNPSLLGAHDLADLEGNNVLRVTGVTPSGGDIPSASLIALTTDAVQFDPDRFDTQVKIGYEPELPEYYHAGISFRLTEGGDKTYGLSFQRSSGKGDPSDNIYDRLKPLEDDKKTAIVLWQSTGSDAKQWMAVKQISDITIIPQITDTLSDADWSGGPVNLFASITIESLPMLPCDFKTMKLELVVECTSGDCSSLSVAFGSSVNWTPVDIANPMEHDVTGSQGQPYVLSFQIVTPALPVPAPQIDLTLDILADDFDIQNATLLSRFKASKSLTFEYNGLEAIEPGDRIFQPNGASASVYGDPLMNTNNPDSGTLLLDQVNGNFEIGNISVIGKTDVATVTGSYEDAYHFIKAYYGTDSGCGTRTDNPLDSDKGANPIAGELNWPPDEGMPWTAENDNFTLIQWDAVNDDLPTVSVISSAAAENTVIRSTEPSLTGLGATLGLHTFGNGSLNVYFDDFGYQSFVDQPVAISQPIQY